MVISAFAVKRSFFSDPFRDSLFQAEIFCVFAAMTLRLHFCSPFTLVATFHGPLTFGGGSVAADHGPNMAQLRSPARSVGWVARQLPTSVVARNERDCILRAHRWRVEGRQLREQISRRKPFSAEARFCCPTTVRVPVQLSGAVDHYPCEKWNSHNLRTLVH